MAQPTLESLEDRIAALEADLARISHLLKPADEPGRDDWKETIGMFANDLIMKEIDAEARKVREEDRAKANK